MQIKENTSIHPGKISLGVGRYASSHNYFSLWGDIFYFTVTGVPYQGYSEATDDTVQWPE